MPVNRWLKLSKSKAFSAMLLAIMINNFQSGEAKALTGGEILSKLNTDAQYHYVSGVLEGIGYSRFLKDRPDTTGSKCIQKWLTKNSGNRWNIVKQWLNHHKEKSAGTILYAMVSKECGR